MASVKSIEKFIALDDGTGYGYGSGCSGDGTGSSSGTGYGCGGSGDGSGYNDGSGSGYGSDGYGYDSGYNDGTGSGTGYGYNDGTGSGSGGYGYDSGYGHDIKEFNNQKVYVIDTIPTIITAVRNNIAKGYVLKSDMTLFDCYIVKNENIFAHGDTLKEAVQALSDKHLARKDTNEVIERFFETFTKEENYSAKEFYIWHSRLTGSCELGRKTFAQNHGIDIENDLMTVKEFIELTENAYGGSVIKKLKEKYQL